ncbi:DUF2490 domain-containing protein, partial [Bacteroides caecimuris]|uniref:DUF2490 domain-containing protein n=1 Tax=Bacteroides caecimuris TaxID=1796613 RepID=UPI0026DEF5B9
MSRIMLHTKIWLFVLLFGMSFSAWAQSDDFNTWTKFKVNHKIDSRFSVSGDLELRMKDDVSRLDRWGLTAGGSYRPYSFLNFGVGYEAHLLSLGDSDWKLRHRYHISATVSFRYQWLKVSLRERFQQTFDRGDFGTHLRSRLKLSYAPTKGIVSPYFSVEIYQSLDDTSFWRADRMRYRPGVEIALAKCRSE